MTIHKLEVGLDRLQHAAEQELKVGQRITPNPNPSPNSNPNPNLSPDPNPSKVAQRMKAARPDTYRRQRRRFMTRLRPLLDSLNASTHDPPLEWVCHSVASVNLALQQHQQQHPQQQPPPPQERPQLAGGAIAVRRRRRSHSFPDGLPEGLPRYVVGFVRDLPTAAQGWRLCTQSAADEARLRKAGRVNLRLAAEHVDGTGFR